MSLSAETSDMPTTQPTHISERPRVWPAVFLFVTAAFGLLIAAADPADLVYAPLGGAAVTLYTFLAAKGNQVFFGERTDHPSTWQRLWAGVVLTITALIAAVEVAAGGSLLGGAFVGLFVAVPVSILLLLAAKANQVLFA